MARLKTSGWESGSIAGEGGTASGSPSIVTEQPHTGTYSLKASAEGFAQFAHTGVADRAYFLRDHLYVSTFGGGTTTVRVLEFVNNGGGTLLAYLRLIGGATPHLRLIAGSPEVQVGSNSPTLTTGTWYLIELKLLIAASGNDTVEARLNETSFASGAVAASSTAHTHYRSGQMFGTHPTTYHDDLALNDDQGATDNSWPGALGEVLSGAATLSGVGTLDAAAQRSRSATVSLAGVGSLDAAGQRARTGGATLAADGDLTAAAQLLAGGTAQLDGAGTLDAQAVRVRRALASLSAQGSLSADGTLARLAAATLTATGSLSADGSLIAAGTASLDGSGDLSAAAVKTALASALLSGEGTLTAAGLLAGIAARSYDVASGTRGPAAHSGARTKEATGSSEGSEV